MDTNIQKDQEQNPINAAGSEARANKGKAYQVITDRIIALLEQGTIPWRRPWVKGPATKSYAGRSYRGINQLLLSAIATDAGLKGCWLTFNQVRALGGKVKKGSKGVPVVLWKWIDKEDTDSEGNPVEKKIPFLRYYTVFSICQTEGIKDPAWLSKVETKADPIESAEAIWQGYQDKPGLTHGGDRACYSPSTDCIMMPNREQFKSMAGYYAALYHEASHSTGHMKRLGRFDATAGQELASEENYGREELVAELGACFLASEAGLSDDRQVENSAAYVKTWISVLKNDPRMVVIAAAQAQKAADRILGCKDEAETSETTAAGAAE